MYLANLALYLIYNSNIQTTKKTNAYGKGKVKPSNRCAYEARKLIFRQYL